MIPDLRPTAVAGTFYPSAPRHLRVEVEDLLRHATLPARRRMPKALIAPHAGYQYSGPVAASAFATLIPFAARIHRVILVGPSHRVSLFGLALPDAVAFNTPLGPVAIDREALASIPSVPVNAAAHAREHALEVELPFLQTVLPRFTIVPLVAGDADAGSVAEVLGALWGGPETLIVVSSDLSHYLPYDIARRVDEATAQHILALSSAPLHHEEACGATPVNGLLLAARERHLQPVQLDLRSSGDTAGGRDQVVGYGAFAFYEEAADVH
jgi:hypothetical protein